MTPDHPQQALLTVALMAAFADGHKADAEREAIRNMAQRLDESTGTQVLAGLYQDVLLKRVALDDALAQLQDPGQRQLAYEMAVAVCDADGRQSAAEVQFLTDLKSKLGLSEAATEAFDQAAEAVVAAGEGAVPALSSNTPPARPANHAPLEPELDSLILNAAKINGALELLPQSWASMAIIPLQVRMVYNIGQAHGVQLDQGHIKEFIAAVGVGVTSQYLEQFGRKLLGGLLGKVAGGLVGGLGRAATGAAFSFASTYALGQVAKRYYAGGRQMSTALLQETFQSLMEPAKRLQAQHMPQIQDTAQSLDMSKVLGMVRGQ
ncbi:DUF533 domain-containing protein [Hydrogenophaga sp. PAMC20947]|uniref:YcjF family protein n=1 Tax=Hydrogenophaga sp. PAMC20947 TaxID=2565558 RepID=UPI00109E0716|nr:DUF533 domain-containing protein [Hydrogenophaga sp. PAMC20947]QCB45592.1 DUF533 domain-containing protein [Hydrogenophaga sp. PAMC20947]